MAINENINLIQEENQEEMDRYQIWEETCIKDVCESIIDCVNKTAPTVEYQTSYKMIRTNNVRNGQINLTDIKYVTKEVFEWWTRRMVPQKGDIILTREAPLGEVGMLRTDDHIFLGQRLMQYRANPKYLDNRFLLYAFQEHRLQEQIRLLGSGATVEHMKVPEAEKLIFLLPPLPEQTAIATVLFDLDSLIEAIDKLIIKKHDIKQATMQQLLTGKTRLPEFNEEWEVKKLGKIAYINMGQSPDSKNYNIKSIGMPLIQGNADIENRKSISRIWTNQITKTCHKDDVIMTVRAPVGSIGIATRDSCIGRGVCSLTPINDDNHFFFHSMVFLEDKWKMIGQGSTFDSVNSSQIAEVLLPIPPSLPEQQAIATILSDMDAEIVALEQKRDKTRALKQGMMQELLTGKTRLI